MRFPKCSHMATHSFTCKQAIPAFTPNRRASPFGWYSFYRPTEGRRLSRPRWLVGGYIPTWSVALGSGTRTRSPTPVLTGLSVGWPRWSRPMRYHYAEPPPVLTHATTVSDRQSKSLQQQCAWHSFALLTHDEQQLSSSWDGRPFGHNRHGPKSRGLPCPFAVPLYVGEATIWPGQRPTSIPSGILLHPTVCQSTPTSQTDRTGQTTVR